MREFVATTYPFRKQHSAKSLLPRDAQEESSSTAARETRRASVDDTVFVRTCSRDNGYLFVFFFSYSTKRKVKSFDPHDKQTDPDFSFLRRISFAIEQ